MKNIFRRNFPLIIIFSIVIIIVFFGFFYHGGISIDNTENQAKTEALKLADKVGKHMFLPLDEVPTIATVSDPEALRDQSFFENAKKGDKVLMYTNAKKAILYDPLADRIISIAPLNTGTNQSKKSDTKQQNDLLDKNKF